MSAQRDNSKIINKIRIVGISASPRRGGNSEILLNKVLEGAVLAGAEAEKIVLNELDFRSCQECGGCDKSGKCVVRDDMERVYKKLDEADFVAISSPIFFVSLSAQTKMMIDRFQCAWTAKYILKSVSRKKKRRGVFISVAGTRKKDYFENAKSIIKAFFATLDIEYSGELFCDGVEKLGDIHRDEKILRKAVKAGRDLVRA